MKYMYFLLKTKIIIGFTLFSAIFISIQIYMFFKYNVRVPFEWKCKSNLRLHSFKNADKELELIWPDVRGENVFKRCREFFEIDLSSRRLEAMVKRAEGSRRRRVMAAIDYLNMTCDCGAFRRKRRYILQPLSEIEKNFPIAFSILVYTDLERFERLLRMIYRPQNHYCVHVDLKSSPEFVAAVSGIVRCLPNVFLSTERYDVRWGTMTVIDPEMRCMRDLLKASKSWKYFINLTGQEAPLKTNFELVNILKEFNGTSIIYSYIKGREVRRYRWQSFWHPLPEGLVVAKGSVHIGLSRDFVWFATEDKFANKFYDWLKNTHIPDETFFATLHRNPQLGTPGFYLKAGRSDKMEPIKLPNVLRFKNWGEHRCWSNTFIRGICMLSVGDLPVISRSFEMFANKFRTDISPVGYDCLEEWYFRQTRDQFINGRSSLNMSYYSPKSLRR